MNNFEIAHQLTSQFIEFNKNYIFDKISNSSQKDLENYVIETTELINKIFNSFYENLSNL